jgi:hypothetical protein
MITFPLFDGRVLAVIEPGNIERLKKGQPMKAGESLVVFTPDIERFLALLGISEPMPTAHGDRVVGTCDVTPEQITEALKQCQNLPEVLR